MYSKDITFCSGEGCPMKHACHRYLLKPTKKEYASYFVEVPYDKENKSCDYAWLSDNPYHILITNNITDSDANKVGSFSKLKELFINYVESRNLIENNKTK